MCFLFVLTAFAPPKRIDFHLIFPQALFPLWGEGPASGLFVRETHIAFVVGQTLGLFSRGKLSPSFFLSCPCPSYFFDFL